MTTNSSNFMYDSGSSSRPQTTPGGYPQGAGTQSKTGLYRTKVPFLPAPVTRKEMQQGRSRAEYTYRNYAVPEFENSDLIGMPAGSHPMINGENGTQSIRELGNTTGQLAMVGGWDAKRLKEIQTVAVKMGWLPKNAITGRPTEKTMSLVAFLMDQGNRTGEPWQTVLVNGPEALRKVGGADVANGSATDAAAAYTGPVTSVSKSVNYTTKAGARNLLRQTLADVLGRGPKEEEVDEFLELLRAKEKANPSITTTVSDGNDEGSMNESSSTSKGGFDEEQAQRLAENYATDINPDQAERYKRAGYEQMLDSLIAGV